MLMDPAFREEVCDAQGAIRKAVSDRPGRRRHARVIDQVQPADGIPAFAKKFVGDEIHLVQTEHWSDAETPGSRSSSPASRRDDRHHAASTSPAGPRPRRSR